MTKILITGASGKLGRLVINHLLESQHVAAADIVAASRNPSGLADLAAKGIETRQADFTDPASLDQAFSGIDRLLIISTDAIGSRVEQHKAAVAAAANAKVGRIFYTSMPNPETSKILFAPEHAQTEQAIKASGLAYTILRNNWYMENLFMTLPSVLASGQWHTSAGEGKTAYIAREDIARAIASALAKPVAENIVYTLSGSRAYSNREIAALAEKATGKPLAVVDITDQQLEDGMVAAGIPKPVAPVFASIDTAIRAGDLDLITDDAHSLSGHPLLPLEAFIEANKASLIG
ncbi:MULTISPECIES: SDR family oxidoreductase [Rhizobium/Agrobacterium group]|uniref:SDR family oxidoreductase n=1 Tax=Rhizobium/Agrobacterium group TaxID=227290 RepID=UPI000B400CF7|nr:MULTISPECIES: SDR family oxidoreductase [Rhizobium/Agrobacterium group]MCF1484492.1 SDR family oxidoreductase [Allorhizobium ampelinum]MVA73165.1 NAD(P)H-binding protein [Agrobacterium vitis]NSZ43200.1 SDR family oxidoreductase [Agrobacterium vitis]NTA26857.1 SDR family oxidoreductase [Allorhizobium ampelinum]OVE94679.1 NAD(P)-dependent oxidoreductase [Allorhizobium ampelinum]